MAVHDEVLAAAIRIARNADWSFTPDQIVRALPHLNARTIRTHVTSRCCVNAPANHPHRWRYFRRVGRGRYVVLPPYRSRPATKHDTRPAAQAPLRDVIHVLVSTSAGRLVAECLEVAVVTQGHTLDETVANLRDAITLHLEDGDARRLGLTARPRLLVTFETDLHVVTA